MYGGVDRGMGGGFPKFREPQSDKIFAQPNKFLKNKAYKNTGKIGKNGE
jgi:hypothetical protein